MPNQSYKRGRAAEYQCMRDLGTQGFYSARMAGSHGAADVIAWNTKMARFIQIKTFKSKKPPNYMLDLMKLASLVIPDNTTRELWVKKTGTSGWFTKFYVTVTESESLITEMKADGTIVDWGTYDTTSERAVSDPLDDLSVSPVDSARS